MIKTAQRKMLRLILHTKRKYKPKKAIVHKKVEGTERMGEEQNEGTTDKETKEGSEQNSIKDQDSDVSFQEEADEEIDATDNEEDWIEYIKRITKEAEEHMEKQKIPCWIEIHRRQKWRMARRIASLHEKKVDQKGFRLAPWARHQYQNSNTSRETQKEDGKMISTNFLNRRKRRKRQIRPHEQQQLDDRSKKVERIQRTRRKTYEYLEAFPFLDRKVKLILRAFCPKPSSPTGFFLCACCSMVCSDPRKGDSSLHVMTIYNTLRASTGRDEVHEEDRRFRINRLTEQH